MKPETRIYIVATEDAHGWLADFTRQDVENWDDERFIATAEEQGHVWSDMKTFMQTWNDGTFHMPSADSSVMRVI